MTYGELLSMLFELSPEKLQDTATVYINGEVFALNNLVENTEDSETADVLDLGHMVLVNE